jgi:hypothetical protein
MKGPTPNANKSKRPKVRHTERRVAMIDSFVEFLLRITLHVSADSDQNTSAIPYMTLINQKGRQEVRQRGAQEMRS